MMPIREVADSWASLYANSAALRSVVSFAHVAGLVSGGGYALAIDLGTLRAIGSGPEVFGHELVRLREAHRLVAASLAIVILSGVLLVLADLDALLQSTAFWIKMGFVVALAINGAVLMRLGNRVSPADPRGTRRLRAATLASIGLWLSTTFMGAVLPNVL